MKRISRILLLEQRNFIFKKFSNFADLHIGEEFLWTKETGLILSAD